VNPTSEQISRARLSAGLTQAQAACVCRVETVRYQHWEHGSMKMPEWVWAVFIESLESGNAK